MAGVRDPDVVDFVGEDADGTVCLSIVVDHEWEPDDDLHLKEKVSGYLGFVMAGGIEQNFPDLAGPPTIIMLQTTSLLPAATQELITLTATLLEPHGLGFDVRPVRHRDVADPRPRSGPTPV